MIKEPYKEVSKTGIEQLYQLINLTWDGDLISKDWTVKLQKRGYATRANGWNIISRKGILVLEGMGLIKP